MFESDLLKGQSILITGGGTGLGRVMTERFAELGARVAILGRRSEPLEETVAAIQQSGGTAAWTSADVRDPEQVEAAVEKLERELGHFTGLTTSTASAW